jgi:hypothetical protein
VGSAHTQELYIVYVTRFGTYKNLGVEGASDR